MRSRAQLTPRTRKKLLIIRGANIMGIGSRQQQEMLPRRPAPAGLSAKFIGRIARKPRELLRRAIRP